jgi:large conductance mechanosensitive channel
VASFVEDIVMPLVGTMLGGLNFSTLSVQVGAATIKYGKFIQTGVDFLIVAIVIFFAIKAINRMKREEEKPAAPPAPPRQEVLLEEIRDILKAKAR